MFERNLGEIIASSTPNKTPTREKSIQNSAHGKRPWSPKGLLTALPNALFIDTMLTSFTAFESKQRYREQNPTL